MKNIVKKIGALVLVWVVCLATLSPAYAAKADLPELPKDQCVVDEANVLSSSTEQTIIQLNNQLQANCEGATIGVLTVDYRQLHHRGICPAGGQCLGHWFFYRQ